MFTALTFNMQNGEPWVPDEESPAIDLKQSIEFLRSSDADIMFIQEVEQGHDGGHQVEPAPHYTALRAALNGYHSTFAYPPRNRDELPFGLGLAIFSRFPLDNLWQLVLPADVLEFEYGGRKRKPSERLLIGAEANVAGRRVVVMNAHLQAYFMIGATSDDHTGQRDVVVAKLRDSPPSTLLCGDFNCTPEEGLVDQFAQAGFQPAQTERPTWKRKPYVVDHIFYGAAFTCINCEVIETAASDHHAILATMEFSR